MHVAVRLTSARLPVLKYSRMSRGNARAEEWCSCTADMQDTSSTSALLFWGTRAPGPSLLPAAAFCCAWATSAARTTSKPGVPRSCDSNWLMNGAAGQCAAA